MKRSKAAPATGCMAAKVTAPLTGEQAGKGPVGTAPSFSALIAIGKRTLPRCSAVSQGMSQKSRPAFSTDIRRMAVSLTENMPQPFAFDNPGVPRA